VNDKVILYAGAIHTHEYKKTKRLISFASETEYHAWVYLFNHDVQSLTRIKSGDYFKFIKQA